MLGLGVALPGRQPSWVMQEVYILNTCGSCVHSGQAMIIFDLHACLQMVCKIAATQCIHMTLLKLASSSTTRCAFTHDTWPVHPHQSRSELLQMVQTTWHIHMLLHVVRRSSVLESLPCPALGNASLFVPSLKLWLDKLLKCLGLLWQAHHQAA